jgi:adenine-specific DNA-methyltransferase
MSQQFDKLVALLKQLFQLDQPDLDFGLYRIMHAKSGEVTQFLERDLLPQVKEAFALYKTADKAEIEKELAELEANIQKAGMDPAQSPKVRELKDRLRSEAVDVGALESEVYDRLFTFFRRYYSEGDFLSKRVYKPGTYAIPYEGEEVKLHWANADQYYIKTSEYLRDYAFRLRPENEANPMRVHFRLVDATEGEHGNVKAAEGKDRVFVLSAGSEEQSFISEEDGQQSKELVIRFEYRPATFADWPEDVRGSKSKPPAQKDLSALAEARVLAITDATLAPWIAELGKPHVKSDGERADYSRLRVHLNRYTARNTFDYFIHKDLGGFLRRELDFYIKNEVMHLDDIENETAPRVEQYLSKIKVIRKIAGKVIDFLAQLENFQKKLWLKKKFVVETQYCITLDCIPEDFYPEIAANEAQREEWVRLFAIDEIEGDLTTPGYRVPLTPAFLKANPTLMVNSLHFAIDFTQRLLDGIGDVDEQVDGMLFHSENFQALSLMQAGYPEEVDCIYIDPPYNTGSDGFCYRDSYQRSSWNSALQDRLEASYGLLSNAGAFFVSIDDFALPDLRMLLDGQFGAGNFVAANVWQKRYSRDNRPTVGTVHEYILLYARQEAAFSDIRGLLPPDERSRRVYRNPNNDPKGAWRPVPMTAQGYRPNQMYEVMTPKGIAHRPPEGRCWSVIEPEYQKLLRSGRIWFGQDEKSQPNVIRYLSEVEGFVPWTWWPSDECGHTDESKKEIYDLNSKGFAFETPKPVRLLSRILNISTRNHKFATVLDYFAGSGTTGHAVINLNREDGGRRTFILVEMGDYFDTVLLPRLKKVTFSPEWKDGRPKRLATPEEAERSPRIMKVVRLESYEDALNNLETQRTDTQRTLLDAAEAQGPDGLKEQYLLRYMLDVETRGSQSLLNVQAFQDPTAYKLKVKRPGSDESREVNVDLIETFNWLIGLTVRHFAAPRTFNAAFYRDSEKRLCLKDKRLAQDPAGPWWFRTVTGTTPDSRKTLVIWRKLTGNPEEDNLVLDTWFEKQGYSSKDSELDLIYVNGGNNLENLKTPDDTWKVRLIEEDFHRLMFETEDT